jgi:predicted amidophosphoribosyltransferase
LGNLDAMATSPPADQVAESCQHCGAELQKDAAYCDNCGRRTRRATRAVRYWARLELLFLLLMTLLVAGFALTFYIQR